MLCFDSYSDKILHIIKHNYSFTKSNTCIFHLLSYQLSRKKKPTMSKTSNLLSEIKVIFTKHFLATKPVNNKAKEYPKACEGQRYRISFLEGDLATRTGLSFYAFVPTNSTSRNLPLRKYVGWKQNLV